jgi:hypothetical protein
MKAFFLIVLTGVSLCSTTLQAQNSAVAPRITTDVNELSLATLKGNVPRLAQAQFDQGEAEPSTPLTHMRLVLSRSSQQQAALDTYLAQLQDKSSPNYHMWLTPEQFGQLYGPADSDIAALVTWLESHGLQVEPLSKGHTNIAFNGTVSQVEVAFHTSIHSFLVNRGQAGEQQFTSNTTDPQIPSALAPVVMGVAHLNTIRPKPHLQHAGAGIFNPQTKRLEPTSDAQSAIATPYLTSGGNSLFIVPGDAATIYNTPNSFNVGFPGTACGSSSGCTGVGVNIGVGGDATISASIVQAYRSRFLGSSTSVNLNYCTTSASCFTTPGSGYRANDADEAYIDTELSGGLAPGASIYYYASVDLVTGIEAALEANVVDIFSLSFGECEEDMSTSDNALINGYWQQAAGEGIAVTVSTGDSGSAGCDGDYGNTVASLGLSVSGFASTPYNIAVGGTDFYALIESFSTYVSTSSGSYYQTAKKYIPESTWNDSTTQNGEIIDNIPLTGSDANIAAGSGGKSSCSTNSTTYNSNGDSVWGSCTSGYSKPTWQTGIGVPLDGVRDIPDVSMMSGNGADNAAWLVCTADTFISGGTTYTTDCVTRNGNFAFSGFGGTSTAAPAFAGILAMVQQSDTPKAGCPWVNCSRLGQAATQLYALYNGNHASDIFHDQNKVGNISVPCTNPSSDCAETTSTSGYYFERGYNTNTNGYDLATGLSSVNATNLVNYWSSSTGSASATVAFTSVSPNPVTTVGSLTVTVSVTGGSGTPTGTITLIGGSYNSSQTIGSGTCSAASCAFTIAAGNLAIGTDTLTANYSGNSTYAVATNSTTVTVNGLTAAVTATPSASSIFSYQTLTVTGNVACTGTCTGSPTPTGTVTLTGGGYTSAATALTGGSYSITIPYNSLASTLSGELDTLTVTYNGNSIYDAGATGTAQVTVTYVPVLTPNVTVNAAGSVDSGQSLSVTVTVSGSSTHETSPTGTVTLTIGSYNSGAKTLVSGSYNFIIPPNSLGAGADTLTATYSGDAYYTSGVNSASVTVTTSSFALAATTPSNIAPGASTTSTVTVSSSTFYSGTVTLTCALTSYPSGAEYLPNYTVTSGSPVTLSSGVVIGTGQATITVYTTAGTSELLYPRLPGRGWTGAGGGAALAFLLFLGIPARRRSWRSMLGILVVMAALGSLAACGGGFNRGGGGSYSGTTAGTYTFTVTGTGNPTVTLVAPTTTFTVTVN